jgi:hypothetical protein
MSAYTRYEYESNFLTLKRSVHSTTASSVQYAHVTETVAAVTWKASIYITVYGSMLSENEDHLF